MSVDVVPAPSPKARSFPLHRTLSRFVRDPLRELERIGRTAGGDVIRLDLGASRPFVATHPDHVQQVLKGESQNFVRAGTFWQPLHTHRLESVWERPLEFDPERFSPERARSHHRYAYFPFGGGPYMCIGRHVFNFEAELILTSVLSRFRPRLTESVSIEPRIGATIRPQQDIEMTLVPVAESA